MPYGGNIFGTVSADLLQTDVDAIVQGLTGPGDKTITDIQDRLNNGLFTMGMYPYLDELQWDMYYYLYSQWSSKPWMELLCDSVDNHLFDEVNNRPLLESVLVELSAVRAVLDDVHDAAQHALRTV